MGSTVVGLHLSKEGCFARWLHCSQRGRLLSGALPSLLLTLRLRRRRERSELAESMMMGSD